MWYWAETEITGSHGWPGWKEKVEVAYRVKTSKHTALKVKENKKCNGSVREMKLEATMTLSGNAEFKAIFCHQKFSQSWAVRNIPETL